jgi:hypothetical protein
MNSLEQAARALADELAPGAWTEAFLPIIQKHLGSFAREQNDELNKSVTFRLSLIQLQDIEIVALKAANRDLQSRLAKVEEELVKERFQVELAEKQVNIQTFETIKATKRLAKVEEEKRELVRDKERLETLLNMTDNEAEDGSFKVTLDYNNYQDGARIINGNGKIVADCYDVGLGPNDQFRKALDKAALAKGEGKCGAPQ